LNETFPRIYFRGRPITTEALGVRKIFTLGAFAGRTILPHYKFVLTRDGLVLFTTPLQEHLGDSGRWVYSPFLGFKVGPRKNSPHIFCPGFARGSARILLEYDGFDPTPFEQFYFSPKRRGGYNIFARRRSGPHSSNFLGGHRQPGFNVCLTPPTSLWRNSFSPQNFWGNVSSAAIKTGPLRATIVGHPSRQKEDVALFKKPPRHLWV